MACMAMYTTLSMDKFYWLILHTKLESMRRKMAVPLLLAKADGFAADGLPSKSLRQSSVVSKVCKAWQPRYYQSMAAQTLSQ